MDFSIECIADLNRFQDFITKRAIELAILYDLVNKEYETNLIYSSMEPDGENNTIEVVLEYQHVHPHSREYNLKHYIDITRGMIVLSDYEWNKYKKTLINKINMRNTLFLLRGLPGSGKSTLAKSISYQICEADQYFRVKKDNNGTVIARGVFGEGGEYVFDPSQIQNAHRYCKKRCENFMESGYEKVVVSNTFTREWEMEEYYNLAEKYNYIVHSIIVENRHGGVNTHGVPDETLDKMESRFEVKLI